METWTLYKSERVSIAKEWTDIWHIRYPLVFLRDALCVLLCRNMKNIRWTHGKLCIIYVGWARRKLENWCCLFYLDAVVATANVVLLYTLVGGHIIFTKTYIYGDKVALEHHTHTHTLHASKTPLWYMMEICNIFEAINICLYFSYHLFHGSCGRGMLLKMIYTHTHVLLCFVSSRHKFHCCCRTACARHKVTLQILLTGKYVCGKIVSFWVWHLW